MTKIAVLLTSHNRREVTLQCLTQLAGSAGGACQLDVFLVEDGSTDGTSEAVKSHFPTTQVISGDGNLYWNGGMRVAWISALKQGSHDYFLWLNDDLKLADGGIRDMTLYADANSKLYGGRLMVVGRVASEITGEQTYGGLVRAAGISKLRFVQAKDRADSCDTMNGNCVLIPRCAVNEIGINSLIFRHSFGDIDYGLRARRAGYAIIQSKEFIGYSERNSFEYTSPKQRNLAGVADFLVSAKGMPVNEWFYFARTHGGILWPINFILMYIKAFSRARS